MGLGLFGFLSRADACSVVYYIDKHPGSANVYDSMGDYCLAQTDTLKAIDNFSKALELGDNPITREKLDQLITIED